MDNTVISQDNIRECTGCSICYAVCPTDAIQISLTKEGFYEPILNKKKCIKCGRCKNYCYKYDENIIENKGEDSKVFAMMNSDDNELKTSTSGGASSELMKECIDQGYKVVGVSYDYNDNIAITEIAEEKKDLIKFKGSKYFQSFTADSFKKVINKKSNEKYAIFGTPCQIYSLNKVFGFRKEIIYVDIFCHGCPSLSLWKKYLKKYQTIFNTKTFDRISFRSKTYAWHEYSTTFKLSEKERSSPKINDEFYELFFDKNALCKACYDCKLRSSLGYSDIRLGDFWGTQYDTNTKGVSLVTCQTKIGKSLIAAIQDRFEIKEHKIEEGLKAQSFGKNHNYDEVKRMELLEELSGEKKIGEIVKNYKKSYSLKKKVRKVVINILKQLPTNLYFKLKKLR